MNPVAEEWWVALRAADAMPFGPARTQLLHRVVADTDAAGAPEAGTAARIALIEGHVHDGMQPAALAPFDWLLARYDEAPPWFGDWERRSVLRAFRHVTAGVVGHPEVARARIEAGVVDMAERYHRAGEGQAPVLACRYAVTAAMDGTEVAHAAYLAWASAPRTALSDCAACEAARRAGHLAALGRHEEAVRTAGPVLDRRLTCPDQPQGAIAEVLASLLLVGDGRRAAAEHVRGVRLLQATAPGTPHARHLAVCARSGRTARGLDLLEGWLPADRDAPLGAGPEAELWMAADAARLLRGLVEAGRGATAVTPHPAGADELVGLREVGVAGGAGGAGGQGALTMGWPVTVAELELHFTQRARTLAARFDARNGTTAVGAEVAGRLAAAPLPDLPLDAITRPGWPSRRPPTTGALRMAADPAALAASGDVEGLAAALDEAMRTEAEQLRLSVLSTWRLVRGLYREPSLDTPAIRELAVARLDGWLAVERMADATDDGAPAAASAAGHRLRAAAGQPEALLHGQLVQLAAVRSGRISAAEAEEHVAALAATAVSAAASGDGSAGVVGVALSRLVVARQLVAPDASPQRPLDALGATPVVAAALADPVSAGIELLESVPAGERDHHQRRALARLLRVRAGMQEEPDAAIPTLQRAIAALPPGDRPRERAMAHADLATTLQQVDPAGATNAWQAALADAAATGDEGLTGSLLASLAGARHAVGDVEGAVDDLVRALPLLDRQPGRLLASQARFDLARALLDAGRTAEAAEVAETALDLVTDILAAEGVRPAMPHDLPPNETDMRGDVHLAGCAAFVAAEASAMLGGGDRALDLARLSARWHRRNGNLIAEAESLQLAARCGDDPDENLAALDRAADLADAGGDWARAATCRRERAGATYEAAGPEAALAVVEQAQARLAEHATAPIARHAPREVVREGERQLIWHGLALAEQRTRLLALAGRFQEALEGVRDLDAGYREVGDEWSARDVLGLRGQVRAELGDLDGGLDDLQEAAGGALVAGDFDQARGLAARLAAVLDAAGRPEDAEKAWRRFSGE